MPASEKRDSMIMIATTTKEQVACYSIVIVVTTALESLTTPPRQQCTVGECFCRLQTAAMYRPPALYDGRACFYFSFNPDVLNLCGLPWDRGVCKARLTRVCLSTCMIHIYLTAFTEVCM